MKFRVSIATTLAALLMMGLVGLISTAQAAEEVSPLEKQFLEQIDKLMPGMGAEKIEDRKDPQLAFEKICMENSGPGKEKEREALCKAIMTRVQDPDTKITIPARVWLMRKVEPIGREEVVPALAKLLHAECPCMPELARRALENNPTPKAGAALRDELKVAKEPAWRVAIINTLAFRHDGEAVEAIAADLSSSDEAVAKAAYAALGDIATPKAIALLKKDLAKVHETMRGCWLIDACMKAAERAAATGDKAGKAAAVDIYRTILKFPVKVDGNDTGETVPMAALAGLARVGGAEEAMPELLKAITNPAAEKDVKAARMQLAAASYAVYLPGEKVTKELVDAVAKAEPPVQAVLIDTLGKRGDAAARATVIKALKSSDPDVQVAAIGALKTLGNGESVKVLADIAATTTGAQRDAARESLKWMKGTDVDEAITAQVASAKDRVKAELIRAAAVRLMKPLMNEMLAFVNDSDDSVRTPVIYNVGKLAELKDLPKVLKAFTTANDSSADAINEAIVRIGGRVGPAAEQKDPSQKIQMVKQAEADANKRATALVAAMKEAGPASQALVVRALLNSRCAVALEAVREAAKSQDERVKQAAAKALAAWGPVYCYDFVFSGPYRKDGAKVTDLFDVAFPPEDASAQVEWKQIGPETDSARFDLQQVDRGNDCCAYMKTTIVSDSDQDVILTFGSDDGVKVWLNGQVVHSNNTTRAFTADQDQVKASLKKGDNVLMVKVTQGGSDWKLMFGTKSVDGGPAGGIRYQAK